MTTGAHMNADEKVERINYFAEREGWTISETSGTDDGGDYRIEHLAYLVDKVFADDHEAWMHVLKLAFAGSVLHREALDFIWLNNRSEWNEIGGIVDP